MAGDILTPSLPEGSGKGNSRIIRQHFCHKNAKQPFLMIQCYSSITWFYYATLLTLALTIKVPTIAAQAASLAIPRPLSYGAWLGDFPTAANIHAFEQLTGHHLDGGNFFINWSTSFSFIVPSLQALDKDQSQAMVTWEPWEYNTQMINNGQLDNYIRDFARGVRSYKKILLLRPMHEMNANWYPWALGDSKVNTNTSYIQAWKHIVNVFRQEGATNAKFVWSINTESVGVGASFVGAYPGDGYVDYVGVDGYNWGTTQSWGSTWKTFDQTFSSSYQALTRISSKPVLIPEWASAEIGGNKAAWITDAFQQLVSAKYSRIVGVYWFDMKKETDWRIDSSQAALEAYKSALKFKV